MIMTPEQIIAAARECLETPFRHQGRQPGLGLDCVGLVRYPLVRLCGITDDFRTYSLQAQPEHKTRAILAQFDHLISEVPKADMRPGDILWMRFNRDPQHFGLFTGWNLIHAVNNGRRRVVEHGFRAPWPARVRAVFRYRGVQCP